MSAFHPLRTLEATERGPTDSASTQAPLWLWHPVYGICSTGHPRVAQIVPIAVSSEPLLIFNIELEPHGDEMKLGSEEVERLLELGGGHDDVNPKSVFLSREAACAVPAAHGPDRELSI